jgi:oligoendopeptidase F
VYATVEAWEAAADALAADLPGLEAYAGRLAEGATVTVEALAARDDAMRRLGHVITYAVVDYAVDTTEQAAVARFGRAQTLYGQVLAAASFVEPELLALGRDRLLEWSEDEPALAPYAHYLDDLFRRGEHVRSAEVEELLGMLADAHAGTSAAYSALTDSDLAFAPATGASGDTADVTQGSVETLLASPDRALRRSAWESYADG